MKVLSQVPGTNETIMVQGEVQPVLLFLSEDDIKVIRNMPDDNRWYLQYPMGDGADNTTYTPKEMQDWVEEVQGWLETAAKEQIAREDTEQLEGMKENLKRVPAQETVDMIKEQLAEAENGK